MLAQELQLLRQTEKYPQQQHLMPAFLCKAHLWDGACLHQSMFPPVQYCTTWASLASHSQYGLAMMLFM